MLDLETIIGAFLLVAFGILLATVVDPPEIPTEDAAAVCTRSIPDDLTLQGEGFTLTLKGVGEELNQQLKDAGFVLTDCEQN